jgi:hypothetical protein
MNELQEDETKLGRVFRTVRNAVKKVRFARMTFDTGM